MTTYISSLDTIHLLQKVNADDSLIIIEKEGSSFDVGLLSKLMPIVNSLKTEVKTSFYKVQDELVLVIGLHVLENPEENYIFVDSSFPIVPMFGERVSYISEKAAAKKPPKKARSKKVPSNPKEVGSASSEQLGDSGDKAEKRVRLAHELEALLNLDPKDYDFPMGKDVLHLLVFQSFEKTTEDEEAKRLILNLDYGERIWDNIKDKTNEIRRLVE